MHQRKSNRRYIVIVATSLSLLTMLAPQMAMASVMPGLPPTPPVWAPAAKITAPRAAEVPTLYTHINVQSRMHTIAQPYTFVTKTPYVVSEKMLGAHIQVLNMMKMNDTVEMAAALNNLGWVQEHLGKMSEAEHSYKAALGLFANRGRAFAAQTAVIKYNLAEMYSAEHNILEAMHYYRQALQDMRSMPTSDRGAERQIQLKYDVVRKLILANTNQL